MDNKSFWLWMLRPETVVFLVPIVAIISMAVIKIVKMVHVHNERIAMIQHGIHPDYPTEDKVEE
jgi:hypothetical protein